MEDHYTKSKSNFNIHKMMKRFSPLILLFIAGLLIAAASGIGGGLASVISPAKLQNAAASIDRIGEESQVIRVTFVIALIITAVAAVMTLIWA